MKQIHYELALDVEICFSHINSDKVLKSGEDTSELHGAFFTMDEFWDRFGKYTDAPCTRNDLESAVESLKFSIEYGSGLLIDKIMRQEYAGEVINSYHVYSSPSTSTSPLCQTLVRILKQMN